MKVKKIKINNILSYGEEEIEFNNDLNIIVGANGSGKSNLMNIIIYILKRFCFKNYEISTVWGEERIGYKKRYSIRQKNPLYNSSEDFFLQKHKKGLNKESSIYLHIIFEKQDVNNLNEIKNKKDIICHFLNSNIDSVSMMDDHYQVNKEHVKKIFEVNDEDLNITEELVLKIGQTDKGWKIQNDEQPYIIYMKYFSLIYEILNLINVNHKIKNPFIFFEAYRNNSGETTKVGVNEYNNGNNISNLQTWQNLSSIVSSIGISSTYIMLATQKFGNLMRTLIEEKDGITKFNNLPEYIRLKKYFCKFGYDINIKCISPLNNIYQFYIIRDDFEIEIDTISSGEREIINFIFGMFLEQLNDSIIIIDEPELHLHPNWQKKLIEVLKDETKENNIQIMFVTHSSSFISYNILNNIFRVYKENGYSKCLRITDLLEKDNDDIFRKNLSVVNATNNEKIFFSNFVILVEGITDEILLKKVYEYEVGKINDGLEFISIGGKNNLNNFTTVLNALKIPYFYIGDYDNIYEEPKLKKLFVVDSKKQNKDLKLKKNQSYSCLDLLKSIDILLNENSSENFEKLKISYQLYNSRFTKLSPSEEALNEIEQYIESKYQENIYILKNGEIEDYLGTGTSNKAIGFKKVISLINDKKEFEEFSKTDEYQELKNIIVDISSKIAE